MRGVGERLVASDATSGFARRVMQYKYRGLLLLFLWYLRGILGRREGRGGGGGGGGGGGDGDGEQGGTWFGLGRPLGADPG